MGLLKTAMMSGAAMYGVNKLAKTAQAHQSSTDYAAPPPPPPRRSDNRRYSDPYDYEAEGYHDPPYRQIYGDRSFDRQNYASQDPWGAPGRDTYAGHYNPPPPRRYVDGNLANQPRTAYFEDPQRYRYDARAPSAPPAYENYDSRQRGFIEQQEIQDGDKQLPRSRSAEMIDSMEMFAQQAMSNGRLGSQKGKNGMSGRTEDLINSFARS